jgi:hypothetical protein
MRRRVCAHENESPPGKSVTKLRQAESSPAKLSSNPAKGTATRRAIGPLWTFTSHAPFGGAPSAAESAMPAALPTARGVPISVRILPVCRKDSGTWTTGRRRQHGVIPRAALLHGTKPDAAGEVPLLRRLCVGIQALVVVLRPVVAEQRLQPLGNVVMQGRKAGEHRQALVVGH